MSRVLLSAPFERLLTRDLRFLEEAAKFGELHVCLWSDAAIAARTGQAPKFPFAERAYFIQACRHVARVHQTGSEALPQLGFKPETMVFHEQDAELAARQMAATAAGVRCRVLREADLAGFPTPPPQPATGREKVVVTGCYDWFHTGHIAFFEEAAALGDLHVVVGNDANLLLLKGPGHPMFPEAERCYNAGSIRYVTQAHISTGSGWMDAEPEICHLIRPQLYVVNEDGDKPEKRAFCEQHGIRYTVLKRLPKEGLQRRSSTDLRGF